MLKIDRSSQSLTRLDLPTMKELNLLERQHLQEFICNSPGAFFAELGEKLFLIGKEISPSETVADRIDLLAIDQEGRTVVIELKRGSHKLQLLQAVGYAAMIGQWNHSDLLDLCDPDNKENLLNFIEVDEEDVGREQRIILIAESFEYEVLVSAEWLNERYGVEILCSRIGLSKDPQSNEEYLVCSTVYPAPELASQARIRGRTPKKGRQHWKDWQEALDPVDNSAVKSFFESELEQDRESYLPKRILRFRMGGKRRWNVSARRKLSYTWQTGRFAGDLDFWRGGLSDPDEVVPVKSGASLRFYLKTKKDFEFFKTALSSKLASVVWEEVSAEDALDDEAES